MCTRLLKKISVKRRWFRIFDRAYPYQLNLELIRQTPKTESDVDWVFMLERGFGPVFTSKPSFTKERHLRYKTEKEAIDVADKLNLGLLCLKCGHPKNCTKEYLENGTNKLFIR